MCTFHIHISCFYCSILVWNHKLPFVSGNIMNWTASNTDFSQMYWMLNSRDGQIEGSVKSTFSEGNFNWAIWRKILQIKTIVDVFDVECENFIQWTDINFLYLSTMFDVAQMATITKSEKEFSGNFMRFSFLLILITDQSHN